MLLEMTTVGFLWLVIHPNGCREIWQQERKPDTMQVPAGSQILEWNPQDGDPKDPNLYVRGIGERAVLKPVPPPPPPSPDDVADADLQKGIAEKAADQSVSDEDFVKLLRASFIKDKQTRVSQFRNINKGGQ